MTLPLARKVVPSSKLDSLDLYVTSRCNRRCAYCFLPREFLDARLDMPVTRFEQILSWAERQTISEVTLLGGEPALHPGFAHLVEIARRRGMRVRVVTNGSPQLRGLIETGLLETSDLSRVAVSLDTLSEATQDRLRGRRAWRHAMDTIELLRESGVLFDINVTAVAAVLPEIDALIDFAEEAGCRRVNIHWPSKMGIGRSLQSSDTPSREEWMLLTGRLKVRRSSDPNFFIEIERGFLEEGESLSECASVEISNIEVFPDGRAYSCGLLVDDPEMSSMAFIGDELFLTRPSSGEMRLASEAAGCNACPLGALTGGATACIFDKVSSK